MQTETTQDHEATHAVSSSSS